MAYVYAYRLQFLYLLKSYYRWYKLNYEIVIFLHTNDVGTVSVLTVKC